MPSEQPENRPSQPTTGLKAIQNYETKLKVEIRRWRGPVVQAVAENVLRKQGSGRSQTGFDGREFDDTEISEGCHPSGGISIKVLPFGFDRSALHRLYSVRRRIGGNPKTCRETERQRANGNDDQRTLPSALTNSTMSQRSHISVSSKPLRGIIQHETQGHRHYLGHRLPMRLDTEPRELVARLVPAPEPLSAISPRCRIIIANRRENPRICQLRMKLIEASCAAGFSSYCYSGLQLTLILWLP